MGGDPTEERRRRTTLADLAAMWEAKEARHLKPATQYAYRLALRAHILPKLGKGSLDRISISALRSFPMISGGQVRWTGPNYNPRAGSGSVGLPPRLANSGLDSPMRDRSRCTEPIGFSETCAPCGKPVGLGPDIVVLAPSERRAMLPTHEVQYGVDTVAGIRCHRVDAFP